MALGALDIIIAADTAQLRKGMDEAVGIMKSSTKTMETAAKTAAGAIAGYFAFDSIKGSIQNTLDFADSLSKMSQKVGVSVDALYAMQAAGKLADVNLETLEKSLLKFNKGLGSAELGTGNTANALKNLGISLKDSAGHLKTSDQYLFEVADRFKEMPNGIAKSTLAMELFGKSGAEMIPLLNGGSEALKEYSGIINTDTAQAAERFNDSMTKIGLSAETSATKILTGMLPTIESLSGTFEDMSDWVLKNQSTIDEFTAQAGNDLTALGMVGADAFSLIADTSGDMLKTVASVFNQIPGLMGRSSDDAIENFGFFEYFILGMSTATNSIGQFVANAKMAYASVAEAHAKYGSISGLLTDGGYDAAKARMDYHAADLEAKKYTENVSATYNTLLGLKKEYKAKNGGSESPIPSFELENFDKPKTGKTQAEKDAESFAKLEQKLFDERISDGIKRFEEEQELKKSYLDGYAEIEAKQALEQYEIEKGYLEAYADLEAKAAIEAYEQQKKFWIDLMGNINKAMDDQFFNAMTGKFESFGSWLKDFWGAMTNSLARGLSKSLADAMIDTGAGGIQNIFKTFGGLGSVFGSATTPAALLGASTDSSGFTTTAGRTVFDAAGQITKEGSDVAGVLDALSSAKSVYSLATNGITGYMGGIAGNLANAAGWMNSIGFTAGGNFLTGAGSIFAGNGMLTSSYASMMGGGLTAGMLGAAGGYAMGSIGDKLLGADTRAGTYGAIGGSIGAIAGSIIPGLGTLVGGAIGSALGSLIGGAFGKTKQTGSGIQAWGDISTQSGAGSVQSYADFKKKSWFKSSSWTNYYGLTEKERKGIEGVFQTYDYLLGQLGDLDTIVVSAGRYSGTSFYNAIDKSFIRAFIDNPELTDTFYTAWTEYASEIGKAVQETFATMVSGYVDYTRNYKTWMLESSGNTLESLRLKAEWAQGDLNAYSNLIGVSGVTVENYLDMYSQAIKTTFTPEAINNWQKLGDALKNSTELTKSYTDALKEQTTYIPADMMLQKTGATKTAVDIKQLVNQQGAQTEQTAQLVAVLTETVKVLKKQLSIAQLGNNQGLPA